MPYEIPQQLQYEEKIIFGLTFRQLIYAIIFVLPALIIFLKTELDIYVKATIGIILIGIASLFMFFDFSNYIKRFLAWTLFREAFLMQSQMVKFLGIEKIENGVIYVWKNQKPVKERKLSRKEKRILSEKISDLRSRANKLHDKKRAGKREHKQ